MNPASIAPNLDRFIVREARRVMKDHPMLSPLYGADDIAQEIRIVLMSLDRAQTPPRRALVHLIAERVASRLLRRLYAKRRMGIAPTRSLDRLVRDPDTGARVSHVTILLNEDGDRRLAMRRRTPEELAELRHDVHSAVMSLPVGLRRLCARLAAGESASAIAASRGNHKRVIDRDISAVRERFIAAGLQKYVR